MDHLRDCRILGISGFPDFLKKFFKDFRFFRVSRYGVKDIRSEMPLGEYAVALFHFMFVYTLMSLCLYSYIYVCIYERERVFMYVYMYMYRLCY